MKPWIWAVEVRACLVDIERNESSAEQNISAPIHHWHRKRLGNELSPPIGSHFGIEALNARPRLSCAAQWDGRRVEHAGGTKVKPSISPAAAPTRAPGAHAREQGMNGCQMPSAAAPYTGAASRSRGAPTTTPGAARSGTRFRRHIFRGARSINGTWLVRESVRQRACY